MRTLYKHILIGSMLCLYTLCCWFAAYGDSMGSGIPPTPTLDQVLTSGNVAAHDQKMQYQKMYFGDPSSNAYLWTSSSGYDGYIQYVGTLTGVHLNNTNTTGDGIVATCSTSNNCIKINQTTIGGGAGYAIDIATAGASGVYLRNTWADTTWGKALEAYSYGTVLDVHSYDSTGAGYLVKGLSNYSGSATNNLMWAVRSDGHMMLGGKGAVSNNYQIWASDTQSSGLYLGLHKDNDTGVPIDTYSGDHVAGSATTTDFVAVMRFQGDDSAGATQTYGSISAIINDTTAGSEDGKINFTVPRAGTDVIGLSIADTSTFTGGLAFTGATSAATNIMDAYTEGTWTAVYDGATTGDCATGTTAIAKYTKIGNVVHADINITVTACAIAPTGTPYISLPVTSSTLTNYTAAGSIGFINNYALTDNTRIPTVLVLANSARLYLYQQVIGGGGATAAPTDTAWSGYFSVTYLTD